MSLYKLLFFALVLRAASSVGIDYYKDEIITRFSNEITNWVQTGEESPEFQQLLDSLTLPTSLQRENWRSFTGERSTIACITCQSVLNTFIKYRRNGTSEEEIKNMTTLLCTRMNIQKTKAVCEGLITLNLPIIMYIIDARPNLTASTICGVILESLSCPLNDDEYKWTVDIDIGPPPVIQSEESNETYDILHITDIHYDPNYEPYGNSYCLEPTCCREGQNKTNTNDKVAGYWGDYNFCDTPWHAVVDALDHIKTTHPNVSYVYFTGDIIDHGVWETTRQGNMESLNQSYYQIFETFANIPVYPILGNHEPHPLNQFAPKSITNDELSTHWLYDMMSDLWINKFGWLPESTRSTILEGGYYTHSPKKGFRIIVLNDNVCYNVNWWLWYQPKDPAGQLQWLSDTLLQAEKDKEFVHILAHIPDSFECQNTWRREYFKIIDRFAHIIKAQFNGHTHNDELQLFYGDSNMRLKNVAWNGGSITGFTNLNPNYKLYTVDNKSYAVKDYENWIYNMTLANENPSQRPSWYKSYSFKEEYNVTDLSYDSLNEWLYRLARDEDLLTRYYKNFYKHAAPSLEQKCDMTCMRSLVCRIILSLEKHELCRD